MKIPPQIKRIKNVFFKNKPSIAIPPKTSTLLIMEKVESCNKIKTKYGNKAVKKSSPP